VIRLLHGDDVHEATVHGGAGELEVGLGERRLRGRVAEIAPGSFLWEDGPRREIFHCVRDGDLVQLWFRGRVYELERLREGARPAHRHADGGLEAPMPGRVVKLSVELGQEVEKGAEILVVEAMKMENPVRAPKAGRVTRLNAALGEMVAPGVVLAEIE
jgi:3-methylcrotonyl-CoA carboxylase alpha subunit